MHRIYIDVSVIHGGALKSDFETVGSKRTKECRNRSTTTSDMLSPPRRSQSITQSLVSAGEESCEMLLLNQGCEWNLIETDLKFKVLILNEKLNQILQRSKYDRDKRWQPSRPKVTSLSPSSWSVESSNFFSWLERPPPPRLPTPQKRKIFFLKKISPPRWEYSSLREIPPLAQGEDVIPQEKEGEVPGGGTWGKPGPGLY